MEKSISKNNVIKAIKTEKLKRKRFFDGTRKNCRVCVVGAILRRMSFESWGRRHSKDLGEMGYHATCGKTTVHLLDRFVFAIRDELQKKNYLGALSIYFEGGKNKKECIAFVKLHFPKVLKISIALKSISDEEYD